MRALCLSASLVVACAFMVSESEARRRSSRFFGRFVWLSLNEGILILIYHLVITRSFGPGDWFETTEEQGCDNPPSDGGGGGGGDGGDEGGVDEGFDERTGDEGDDDGAVETSEKFLSLSGVDICDGVSAE